MYCLCNFPKTDNPAIRNVWPGVQRCESRFELLSQAFSLTLYICTTEDNTWMPLTRDWPKVWSIIHYIVRSSPRIPLWDSRLFIQPSCLVTDLRASKTFLWNWPFEGFWNAFCMLSLSLSLSVFPLWLSHRGKTILWKAICTLKGKTEILGVDYHQVLPNRIAAVVSNTSLPSGVNIKGKQCNRYKAPYRVQQCCREAT